MRGLRYQSSQQLNQQQQISNKKNENVEQIIAEEIRKSLDKEQMFLKLIELKEEMKILMNEYSLQQTKNQVLHEKLIYKNQLIDSLIHNQAKNQSQISFKKNVNTQEDFEYNVSETNSARYQNNLMLDNNTLQHSVNGYFLLKSQKNFTPK